MEDPSVPDPEMVKLYRQRLAPAVRERLDRCVDELTSTSAALRRSAMVAIDRADAVLGASLVGDPLIGFSVVDEPKGLDLRPVAGNWGARGLVPKPKEAPRRRAGR